MIGFRNFLYCFSKSMIGLKLSQNCIPQITEIEQCHVLICLYRCFFNIDIQIVAHFPFLQLFLFAMHTSIYIHMNICMYIFSIYSWHEYTVNFICCKFFWSAFTKLCFDESQNSVTDFCSSCFHSRVLEVKWFSGYFTSGCHTK